MSEETEETIEVPEDYMVGEKTYFATTGFRENLSSLSDPRVYVRDEDNGSIRPLTHHPYHSPDGHSWGYSGSGPSELAKDILWDFLGVSPNPLMYMDFREAFIAGLEQDKGFKINSMEINAWVHQWDQDHRDI